MHLIRITESIGVPTNWNIIFHHLHYKCECGNDIRAVFKNDKLMNTSFITRICPKCYREVPNLERLPYSCASRIAYNRGI